MAADGAKRAFYQTVKECFLPEGTLAGCRAVNFIHDQIILETPEQRAHEAAMRLKEVMEKEMSFFVKDVPINATVCLTRRWRKGAKPKFENGRLVPV